MPRAVTSMGNSSLTKATSAIPMSSNMKAIDGVTHGYAAIVRRLGNEDCEILTIGLKVETELALGLRLEFRRRLRLGDGGQVDELAHDR